MPQKSASQFINDLVLADSEEAVKAAYAKFFGLRYNTKGRRDLLTENVLFETKYKKNFANAKTRAAALAQALYYIRRIKYSDDPNKLPIYICIASEKAVAFFEVAGWTQYYSSDTYDWSLAPSSPDPKLIGDLALNSDINVRLFDVTDTTEIDIFTSFMKACLEGKTKLKTPDRKPITDINFMTAYQIWEKHFEEYVRNGSKPSKYFICDIEDGGSTRIEPDTVFFHTEKEISVRKRIPLESYDQYWSIFGKVSDAAIIRGLRSKADRLTKDDQRRREGEFFTPVPFANVALKHIEKAVGEKWWDRGYRLWDMAAGTGNLEWDLPSEAWGAMYLSTLHQPDVDYCKELFRGATCFQYDYLNDDVDLLFAAGAANQFTSWKLPQNLRRDLGDPDLKWIILINPPFATSQDADRSSSSKSKVSDTAIRTVMHQGGLGAASRELFAQFMFRIRHEFAGKQAHFGLFSKIKYLNAPNDAPLREKVIDATFVSGFIFSSLNFAGTSAGSQFPVGFLLWDLLGKKRIQEQQIWVDVLNERVEKLGQKQLIASESSSSLSGWVERPRTTKVMPPFRSALALGGGGPDVRDRVADGFLASLMCGGNELEHQNKTCLLSGPYVSAGALSITKENFEKALVVHAVRRLPKRDWTNDRDPLMSPCEPLQDEFIGDCVVWSLFAPSNNTVSLSDIEYKGATYQIANHLFPVRLDELKKWDIHEPFVRKTLTNASDRFAALWLSDRILSVEAAAVLNSGMDVYKTFYREPCGAGIAKFRISAWDVGWTQVRRALAEKGLGAKEVESFNETFYALSGKLLPQLYSYGFLASTKWNEVVSVE